MKKSHIIILVSLSLASLNTFASEAIVKCSAVVEGKTESVLFRMGDSGLPVRWNKDSFAKTSKSSIFSSLMETDEEDGAEYFHVFKGRNGYSIVQVGTTADEVMVGISPDHTKGFYKYSDLGSGNGNSKLVLNCEEIE